jgi:hypothetical protein
MPVPANGIDSPDGADRGGRGRGGAQAVLDEKEQARLDGLRIALAVLAIIALVGLLFSARIPADQPGSTLQRAPATPRSTGTTVDR